MPEHFFTLFTDEPFIVFPGQFPSSFLVPPAAHIDHRGLCSRHHSSGQRKKHIKGTGTRDYNCVKVVRFDRPWLGESPADIHNFYIVPIILY
jgi:hypothetical protein